MAWQTLFRTLSERYGWTPQQIGALTMAQLASYAASKPSDRVQRMTPAEASNLRERLAHERTAAVNHFFNGTR